MSLVLVLLSALTAPVSSAGTLRKSSELPTLCISLVSAFSDTFTQLEVCESCKVFLTQVTLTSEEFIQYVNDDFFRFRVDACLRPGFTAVSLTIPASAYRDLHSFDEFSNLAIWPLLTSLHVEETYVQDISALALAPNLRDISFLDYTWYLTDISVLSQLPKLEVLRIGQTDYAGISDFSVLASLPKLTILSLKGCSISDLSVFRHLPALTSLELPGAYKISDLSFVQDLCPRLVRLDVSETAVSDLSPLEKFCPNLRHLEISKTDVTDLLPLIALRQLESVGLDRLRVEDPQQIPLVLGALGNLRRVSLVSLSITDLSFLLPSQATLEKLDLSFCFELDWSSLQVLKEFKALKVLDLGYIKELVDLEFLKDLKELQELILRDTGVHDITAISDLNKLRRLDISHTEVKEVTAVGELLKLESLYAANLHEDFFSIEPLKNLVRIRELVLNANVKLRDISSLVGLVLLETLDLGMTQVDDVRVLAQMPKLKWLDLPVENPRGIKNLGVLLNLEFVRLGDLEDFETYEEFRAYLENEDVEDA